jgi:NTP pyrophosphatase (non-canonical NTP hydrolase)
MAESSMEIKMNLLDVLVRQCLKDSERWFGMTMDEPSVRTLVHYSLSMCGEAGEFANIVKKVDRGSLDLNNAIVKHDLADELVDVLTYLLNIAGVLKVDLLKGYLAKRDKNELRFAPKNGEVKA